MGANLSGHDSHGVGMLAAYVPLLLAPDAVRVAIERARELASCVLALRNCSHVGRIGAYGESAARAGMAFTAFVSVADHPDAQAPRAS